MAIRQIMRNATRGDRTFCFRLALLSAGLALLMILGGGLATAEAATSATNAAQRIDYFLSQETLPEGTELAPLTDDATFLRRVTLDVVGSIPSPEELHAFLQDDRANKRDLLVAEILKKTEFGENWGRYWRDVILYRRVEERALLVGNPVVEHLAEEFNKGTGWDEIARRFITAQGDVRENGETAIYMAQDGRTEEVTAEVSRIFLGVQIQCAQCHDHPYDRWEREQFHELAAFFPRVGVRRLRDKDKRSFEVFAVDRKRMPKRKNERQPTPEHYMPDLDNPTAAGTEMTPKFFLTNAEVQLGTKDSQRRSSAAEWITGNPWFAKAFVNRIWAELVGEGFYPQVDDLGPDREPTAPRTLDYLARKFEENNYDIKWLFRTICATEAYQRAARDIAFTADAPFAANRAQPLRGDQIYNALVVAVGMDPQGERLFAPPRKKPRKPGPYASTDPQRTMVNAAFGYDPSDFREDIVGSIPQVLTTMNAPQFSRLMRAQGRTMLAKSLRSHRGNAGLTKHLYERVLSREPNLKELSVAVKHLKSNGARQQAAEDLLWALVNSAEFRYRR